MLLLLLISVALPGNIYRKENPDGSISFSDQPDAGDWQPFILEEVLPATRRVSVSAVPALNDYDELILGASLRYGVPAELIKAVVLAESGMNPKAVSKAGAQGLMQLMPATADELAVEDPFDPADNIDGGTRYLAQQIKTFGSYRLAVAAYNAGPHNVKKHHGVPPFEETQRYVPRVLEFYEYFRTEAPIAVKSDP